MELHVSNIKTCLDAFVPLVIPKYLEDPDFNFAAISSQDAIVIYTMIVNNCSCVLDVQELYEWLDSDYQWIYKLSGNFSNFGQFLQYYWEEKKHYKLLYKILLDIKGCKHKKLTPNYYYLRPGDLIEQGDEYYCSEGNQWNLIVMSVGTRYTSNWGRKIRRQIKKEDENSNDESQYYYLKLGDTVQDGDEYFFSYNNTWTVTCLTNIRIDERTPHKYRRRIKKKGEEGDKNDQYYYLTFGEKIQEGDQYKHLASSLWFSVSPNSVGSSYVNPNITVRRKKFNNNKNQNQDYYFLKNGDMIKDGDEGLFGASGWRRVASTGYTWTGGAFVPMRRKKVEFSS